MAIDPLDASVVTTPGLRIWMRHNQPAERAQAAVKSIQDLIDVAGRNNFSPKIITKLKGDLHKATRSAEKATEAQEKGDRKAADKAADKADRAAAHADRIANKEDVRTHGAVIFAGSHHTNGGG